MMCLLVGVGSAWAEDATLASFSFKKKGTDLPSGWTESSKFDVSRSTGDYYLLSCSSVAEATLTSPSIDFSNYSNITIEFGAGRYGNLTGSKATIVASVGSTELGSIDATSSSNGSYTLTYSNTTLESNAPIVFTCTTEPSSTNTDGKVGARVYSITIKGTPKGGTPDPIKSDVIISTSIVGGTVSATPSEDVEEGTEVTLTATPATDYKFESWNVTNAVTSEQITVTDNKFEMPAANVNVSATFTFVGSGEEPTSGVIYKWDGTGSTTEATQEGGVASVPIASSTNMVAGASQKGNYCFKMNKGMSSSGGPYVILVTLNHPLKAGDVISGAVFRASETAATFGMDLNATSEMTTAIQYTLADPQVLSSNGTPEDNISWTVPAEADGCRYIRLYRASGSTGLYVSKLVVTRPEPATKGTIDVVAKGLMPGYSDIAPELDFYFATFSSDKDVIIEGGYDLDLFGVYTVSVDPEEGVVSVVDPEDISMAEVTDEEIMAEDGFVTGYYVPANTGVLVISMGNQATYYYVAESESNYLAEIDPDGTNMLRPASAEKETDGSFKFYKLAYKDQSMDPASLGFYWGAENGGAFVSPRGGTAYLAVPAAEAANVKGFSFVADDATAIKNVENKVQTNAVYNLAGQRVSSKNYKGIVIKNGKQMLNK